MKNLKRKSDESPRHDYRPKPFPCRTPLNGISDSALKNHHDKLYAGYVAKKNEIENELEELGRAIVSGKMDGGNTTYSELRSLKDGETYAVNGVYLHEWYFEILGGNGKFEHARELVEALAASY